MPFLQVGSGIAGLHTAWRTSDHGDVVVLTNLVLLNQVNHHRHPGCYYLTMR